MTGRPRAASVMPRSYVETSQESSYAVDDSIHRAEYFSNAVLEDTYNQAVSSRGRDNELLRHANATIAYTEHRPLVPRSSIKSRRMRASSVPPRTISVQSPRRRVKISSPAQVAERSNPSRSPRISLAPFSNHTNNIIPANSTTPKPVVLSVKDPLDYSRGARACTVPPMGILSIQNKKRLIMEPNLLVTRHLKASKAPASRKPHGESRGGRESYFKYTAPVGTLSSVPCRQMKTNLHYSPKIEDRRISTRNQHTTVSEPRRNNKVSIVYSIIPEVDHRVNTNYYPIKMSPVARSSPKPKCEMYSLQKSYTPSNNPKAAIIGSRMEAGDGERRYRRPRTMFAANKHRELLVDDIERKYNN